MKFQKLKKFYCKLVGHDFTLRMTSEEMWAECEMCREQRDISSEREEEAHEKIRNRQWDWVP